MQRVEYKIKDVNRKWLEDVLYKHGAERIFEGNLKDIYYDNPRDNFVKKGKRITLRTKGSVNKLTYRDKYDGLGIGVLDEFEVEVSDGEMMDKIMLGLGFTHFKMFKKYRVDYGKDDVIISFDKYLGDLDHIPEFMMIEANSDEEVYKWAELFGYTEDDCEAISVLELIDFYNKRKENNIF